MNTADFIWMDGEFVAWEDAKVHVLSHSLHYGNAAIEGTKAYKTDKGYAIFKLREHTQRLLNSSKMTLMNVPFTLEELEAAQVELIKKNGFKGDSVYLRPLVYLGYGVMGLYHAPLASATYPSSSRSSASS
jgi:branched-chain amino acid aminotransferase